MSVESRLTRHGHVTFLQIPAVDTAKSAAFYAAVFGWHVDGRSNGDYAFDVRDGAMIGRWVTGNAVSRDPGFVPYLYVNDINATAERIVREGGEIVDAPRLESDTYVARFRDPAGNIVGFWQAAAS